MESRRIRLFTGLGLAAAAALGLSQPAQAAPDSGQTQLVTTDGQGNLDHTIRHADGTWQRFGLIPGYHNVSALTSVIVGGEENVFAQYDNGGGPRLGHLVRHTDGTWNYAAATPAPPSGATEQLAAANVNGRIELVRLASTGPEVSELDADGNWSVWRGVPSGEHAVQSIAAVASGGTLRVVELTADGRTVGVADRVDGSWTVGSLTPISADARVKAVQIAAAEVGTDLQVTARYEYTVDPTHYSRFRHGILNSAGSWSGFADLTTTIFVPGAPCDVAMTAANGELQLAYSSSSGDLLHTIRHPDGTWQEPGDVLNAAAGTNSHSCQFVTIAGV